MNYVKQGKIFKLYLNRELHYFHRTANPNFCFQQKAIANFIGEGHESKGDEARKLRALFRATGIETRCSVLVTTAGKLVLSFLRIMNW